MAAPGSVVVRAEVPGDAPAIRQVVAAAFGGPAEADLVDRLRELAPRPFLSLVAEAEGAVAGHVLFTPARPADGPELLALAPLAVAPPAQRRGIGTALVLAGLARAAELGAPGVVVVGDPAYYGRFGFGPAAARDLAVPWDVPPECAMVLDLDCARLPECRGLLSYPAPFADL